MKKILPIILVIAIGLCGCNVLNKNGTVSEGDIASIGQVNDALFKGTRIVDGKYTKEYLLFVFGFVESLFKDTDKENVPEVKSQEDGIKLISAGIAENCVEVALFDPTEDNIARFKETVIDSPALEFIKGETLPKFA